MITHRDFIRLSLVGDGLGNGTIEPQASTADLAPERSDLSTWWGQGLAKENAGIIQRVYPWQKHLELKAELTQSAPLQPAPLSTRNSWEAMA
ncbi:hypothetical protein IXB28_06985 [Leptothoe kymatousa TAU-MAC 1615]|uniref:Uncharacterized protein n=1 Tax=Leptothoe kymatousa TAU-MAC 1615 TaxID=2364775 RepID=A0ABS5Y297_9CYAN|nr:hypothetical protein [Leptothoe kymatousa TAU-MAC 1615]